MGGQGAIGNSFQGQRIGPECVGAGVGGGGTGNGASHFGSHGVGDGHQGRISDAGGQTHAEAARS